MPYIIMTYDVDSSLFAQKAGFRFHNLGNSFEMFIGGGTSVQTDNQNVLDTRGHNLSKSFSQAGL